ncbi:MAG: hypothetical protein FD149_984 [Rhodospirillaceae bacterium]|nr:MAG: hypothetical protein FD149_984 [Rhodospirillaceae bacterium]
MSIPTSLLIPLIPSALHTRQNCHRKMYNEVVAVAFDQERPQKSSSERDQAIRDIIAHFPDGLLVTAHGIVRMANRAFERICGLEAGSVEGCAVKEILKTVGLSEGVVQTLTVTLTLTGRQTKSDPIEVEGRDAADTVRILQIRRFPIAEQTEHDVLEGLAFADITERWTTKWSIDMLREQLLAADRRAAAGEISMALAHEINQLLGAIINFAGAARRRLQGRIIRANEIENALQSIAAEATRAAEVIKSLRSFLHSRLQPPEPADINNAIEATLGFAEPALQAHEIRVNLSFARGMGAVQADPVILQQILLNLVTNAVQAMSGVPVEQRHLRIRTGGGRNGVILVIVDDTGIGLPTALGQQIFEPFVTTKENGSGLGLSITRTLVQRLGGSIEAHPRRPHGARFIIRLPCSPVKEANDA